MLTSTHRTARLRLRLILALIFAVLAGLQAPEARRHTDPDAVFDGRGLQAGRPYLSTLPFENIDTATGKVVLSFSDLSLPGNNGFGLSFVRSATDGDWHFGIAGIPLRNLTLVPSTDSSYPLQSGSAPQYMPTFVTADGAYHESFYTSSSNTGDTTITRDFWRYTISTQTLEMPNGTSVVYDSHGLASSATDTFGNSVTFDWVSDSSPLGHHLYTVTQALDGSNTRVVTFTYATDALLPSTMVYDGHTWTYNYSSIGFMGATLQEVVPPTGPSWEFGGSSTTWTVTTPAGGTVTYTYDSVNFGTTPTGGGTQRALVQRDVSGGTWTFAYDGHTKTTVTGPSNKVVIEPYWSLPSYSSLVVGPVTHDEKIYDLSDNLLSTETFTYEPLVLNGNWINTDVVPLVDTRTLVRDGRTFTTTNTYSGSNYADYGQPNNVVSESDGGGLSKTVAITFKHDFTPYIRGRVLSTTTTEGSASFSDSRTYNASTGFLSSVTSAGVTTSFSPDSYGNTGTITDANSHVATMEYTWGVPDSIATPEYTVTRSINSDGTVYSETRRGLTTGYTYDALGRVYTVTPPTGDTITTSYNSNGHQVTVTRGSSSVTADTDGFGRPIGTTDAASVRTVTTYDAEGRKTYQSYPFTGSGSGTGLTFGYDALGRRTTTTHPIESGSSDTATVSVSYSDLDVTVTDENAHATVQHWLAFGDPSDARLSSVTDAASHTWTYSYNVFGSLTEVAPPSGSSRTWSYDTSSGRLTSETQPESGTIGYMYDAVGNLASKTDAAGQVFHYTYDGNNRLTAIDAPGTTSDVAITYDASDNRTAITNGVVSTSLSYDNANRLTSRTDTIAGHAFTVGYGYDTRDNLTSITYPSGREIDYAMDAANRVTGVTGSGSATYASSIAYHPTGAIASYTLGNGTTESLTLDAQQRPKALVSGPLDLTYAYDPVGNVASITDPRSGHSSSYGYDALDRLTSVTGFGAMGFSYDALGNRTLKDFGTSSVTYSTSGTTQRLSSATDTTGHETGTYSYDANGNATADSSQGLTFGYTPFNMLATSTVSSVTSAYQYDGDGMRVIRATADGVHYYVRAGAQTLAEYSDVSGTPLLDREYVYLGAQQLASIARAADAAPARAVRITSPHPADNIPDGQSLTVTATASATSGTVARVEFYVDGVFLSSDTSSPYAVTWSSPSAASYTLLARVVTTAGDVATSPVVPITIRATGRVTGVSVSSSPVQNSSATVTVSGNSTTCGSVQIDYGDGTVVTYADGSLPASHAHTWTSSGSKTVTATGEGDCLDSASTSITVASGSISVTSVVAATSGDATQLVTVYGSSSCSAVTVNYGDGNVITYAISGLPMSNYHTWTTAGTYTVTATGQSTCTGSVTTSTVAPDTTPSTVQDVSVSNATPTTSQSVTITVSGNNPCGAVQIDTGDGSAPYLPISGLPYTYSYTWSTAGTYTITATGEGNCSGVKTTSVTVSSAGPPREATSLSVSVERIALRAATAGQVPSVGRTELGSAATAFVGPTARWSAATTDAPDDTEMPSGPFVPASSSAFTTSTLTVDLSGTGSGSVSSSPSGISCSGSGTTCDGTFTDGTSITLTASASSGSSFAGWGGACSGTSSTCTVTGGTVALVVANFAAAPTYATTFYHVDVLGSVRAVSDGGGSTVERHDYLAFGEETAAMNANTRFAGKERDAESQLDYSIARMYGNASGRFSTSDPGHVGGSIFTPQTMSAYAYAVSNPLRFADPLGTCPTDPNMPCFKTGNVPINGPDVESPFSKYRFLSMPLLYDGSSLNLGKKRSSEMTGGDGGQTPAPAEDKRGCDGPTVVPSMGVSGTAALINSIGASLMAGYDFKHGNVDFTFSLTGMIGAGLYLGYGGQLGAALTEPPKAFQISQSSFLHVEGNVALAFSGGLSADIGSGGISAAGGAKVGEGFGVMVGLGLSHAWTLAIPNPFSSAPCKG